MENQAKSVSADEIAQMVKDAINEAGIPQMLENLKQTRTKTPNPEVKEKKEEEEIEAPSLGERMDAAIQKIASKQTTEDLLGGKAL